MLSIFEFLPMRVLILTTVALVFGIGSGAGAQFADSVTVTPMGGSVYMLEGAGDIITASVGPDGILLVDNGFPETLPAVRAALERLGRTDPRYVINTHWHHSGANEAFAEHATIVAHRRSRVHLRDGAIMYTQPMPPREPAALPDVVFSDSMSVYFNGERVDLLYLPHAHTDSDIAVIFTESNVAALGDVFVTFLPITDYGSGGDLYASVDAIELLLERLNPETRIVPGHGLPATYADLETFHTMVTDMIAYMEAAITAGRTVDDVIAAGIPARWQDQTTDLLTAEFVLRNFYEGVQRRDRPD